MGTLNFYSEPGIYSSQESQSSNGCMYIHTSFQESMDVTVLELWMYPIALQLTHYDIWRGNLNKEIHVTQCKSIWWKRKHWQYLTIWQQVHQPVSLKLFMSLWNHSKGWDMQSHSGALCQNWLAANISGKQLCEGDCLLSRIRMKSEGIDCGV